MKQENKRIHDNIKKQEGLGLSVPIILLEGIQKEKEVHLVKAGDSRFYNDTLRTYKRALKPISKYDI